MVRQILGRIAAPAHLSLRFGQRTGLPLRFGQRTGLPLRFGQRTQVHSTLSSNACHL